MDRSYSASCCLARRQLLPLSTRTPLLGSPSLSMSCLASYVELRCVLFAGGRVKSKNVELFWMLATVQFACISYLLVRDVQVSYCSATTWQAHSYASSHYVNIYVILITSSIVMAFSIPLLYAPSMTPLV